MISLITLYRMAEVAPTDTFRSLPRVCGNPEAAGTSEPWPRPRVAYGEIRGGLSGVFPNQKRIDAGAAAQYGV